MRILLFLAQGSSLETFREQFTNRATEQVKAWFADNKQRHPEINVAVSDFFIHLHTVWMFTLFEEMLMNEEGMQDTANKMIHIGKPIDLDETQFFQGLEKLNDASRAEAQNIRDLVKEVVTTYHPKSNADQHCEEHEKQMARVAARINETE